MRENKNLSSGTYYLVGNLFSKGIAFITVPIYSRILSPSDYGTVYTYVSWVSILSLLFGLSLHMGIRSAFSNSEFKFSKFTSSIIFLQTIIYIFLFLIALFILIIINFDIIVKILVLMAILNAFSLTILQSISMYFMMQYRYKAKTFLLILPNLISTIISIFLIVYFFENYKYLGKIIPSTLIHFSFALIILVVFLAKEKVFYNLSYWKYGMTLSVPLVIHSLSLNILNQSDRIILTSLRSSAETGIYSLIYNFGMITSIFVVTLDSIWVPWFTEQMAKSKIDLINSKAKNYTYIMLVATISLMLVSPEVLYLLAPSRYWIGIYVIPPIVISGFITYIYSFYINVEHHYKNTKIIALTTINAAILNIVLNLIFIPIYGLYAAAVTTLISYILSLALHYKVVKNMRLDILQFSIFFVPIITLFFVGFVFYFIVDYAIIRWGALILTSCYVLIFKRNMIKKITKDF